MRRIVAYTLVTLGLILLFLSPLLRFYVTPRVEKAPLDLYDRPVASGTGVYFSQSSVQVVGPRPLQNVQVYRGDVDAGSKSVAVYDHFDTTRDLTSGELIDISRDRVAFDRVTGEAVDCCGARKEEGETLKLPFHTQRITYQFWDGTLGAAAPMKYVRDDDVAGFHVYVFRQEIPPTQIDVVPIPGSLAGDPESETVSTFLHYSAVTTIWVEPKTGAVLKGVQHARRWLTNGGKELFVVSDTNLGNTPESVATTAARLRSKLSQLDLVRVWIPLVGLILGPILLVIGILLLVVRGRREPDLT